MVYVREMHLYFLKLVEVIWRYSISTSHRNYRKLNLIHRKKIRQKKNQAYFVFPVIACAHKLIIDFQIPDLRK